MNAIHTIAPYKWNGQWVFDDESVGLVKEPFVAGADTLIDKISDGATSCVMLFSEFPFPGADHKIKKLGKGIGGGTDYYHEGLDHRLWLCPALFKYYPKAPKNIYIQIKVS